MAKVSLFPAKSTRSGVIHKAIKKKRKREILRYVIREKDGILGIRVMFSDKCINTIYCDTKVCQPMTAIQTAMQDPTFVQPCLKYAEDENTESEVIDLFNALKLGSNFAELFAGLTMSQ